MAITSFIKNRKHRATTRTQKSRLNSHLRPTFEPLEERALMAVLQGGDFVVVRVGDGSSSLVNKGNPVFLDEYTASGTFVQSIAVPAIDSGATHALAISGTGTSEGGLARSADGRYLTLAGYDVNVPPGGSGSLNSQNGPRTIGRLAIDGTVNTTTTVTFPDADNVRSAVSDDGTHFWATGGKLGIQYVTLGSSTGTDLTGPTGALRNLNIFDGQLYVSDTTGSQGGVQTVGTGLPTSGALINNLSGIGPAGNVAGFFMAHLQAGGGTAPDTLYMANSGTNSLDKFSLVGGTWVSNGSIAGFSSATNLAGQVNTSGGVSSTTLLVTTGGSAAGGGGTIWKYTDTAGYNAAPSAGGITSLVSLASNSNMAFRGIALAPNVAPVLDATGHPALDPIIEDVTNAANVGTLVSDIIFRLSGSKITDPGQAQGIAVTAATTTNGSWQYSTDGGSNWLALGAVSGTSARLLASNANTRVRFVPNADFNGSVNPAITFRAWDQSSGSNGGTADASVNGSYTAFSTATNFATLAVTAVNDAPSFNKGADDSTSTLQVLNTVSPWATGMSSGPADEAGQALTFVVTGNTNSGIFSSGPTINASTGALSYTPSGIAGSATISLVLQDNGSGISPNVNTSAVQTFVINISSVGVNQAPQITAPPSTRTTLEDTALVYSGANKISFADDDANQGTDTEQITVTVTGGTATLSGLAGLSGTGNGTNSMTYTGLISNLNAALDNLSFAPTADLNGGAAASIQVVVNDLGHTGAGGAQISSRTMAINITPVNDAPTFTVGANQVVAEDAGPQSVSNWPTAVSAGPADESGQSIIYLVSNNNNSLFSVQPTISPAGTLTYTPAANAVGSATVTVQVMDNGGTANGGGDTSPTQTFTITTTAVNDNPVNTYPAGTLRAIQNQPFYFSAAEFNAISIADLDAAAGNLQVSLAVSGGTVTLGGLTGLSGSGNGTASLTYTGTLASLNAALDGLAFTSTNNFIGTATIQITTNDLGNTGAGGAKTDIDTVSLNVVAPSPLVINEVLNNPPGNPDIPNSYLEFRSPFANNYTVPNGTYLISVTGNPFSVTANNVTTDYPQGTVVETFDLSGNHTGSNGMMVLVQKDNPYVPGGVIDPHAQVYDNTGSDTGAGWGNNLGSAGSSAPGINHNAIVRAQDVQTLHTTATYLLVHVNSGYDPFNPAIHPGDDLDDGLTGALHGSVFDNLTVLDSVGAVENGNSTPGWNAYGYLNFNDSRGTTNVFAPNSQVVPGAFSASYIARSGNTVGYQASDWVAGDHETGSPPMYSLSGTTDVTLPSLALDPLNHLGAANFLSNVAPTLTTTSTGLIYAANSGPQLVDPNITISDPDSAFYSLATIELQGYVAGVDSLSFADTPFIVGSFDSGTGTLTLSGADTLANYQAALRSVTYTSTNPTGPTSTRVAVFTVHDGVSTSAYREIRTANVTPVIDPNGSTAGNYTTSWSGTAVNVVDPSAGVTGGTVTDTDDANLRSMTVAISAHAGDVLSAQTAGTSISQSFNGTSLVLSGLDTVAHYQQVLRTVQYHNTGAGPGGTSFTATITAVDAFGGTGPGAVTTINIGTGSVMTNAFVFYKGSSRYDTTGGPRSPLAFSDDNAIATDKSAYVPNGTTANFGNYSSYSKGINGIMIDLKGSGNHSSITLANILNDFTFKVGNNATPGSWANAPTPSSVTVRTGMTPAANGAATVSGSDRIEITWTDNAIQQQWLEVIAKPTPNTGLAANTVFFYGNEIGNTSANNTTTVARTGSPDLTGVQTHGAILTANIPITNVYDFDRDGKVGASDLTAVQTHGTSVTNGLKLIVVASTGPFAPDALPSASPAAALPSVASYLGISSLGGITLPSIPPALLNRLGSLSLDLNSGPLGKYFEKLAHEATEEGKKILSIAEDVADFLHLDHSLLDSLLDARNFGK